MGKANVRYIVSNVDDSIKFYAVLGFSTSMRGGSGFAALERNGLRLFLNKPGAGGAGQVLPGRGAPVPGGWNRIQIEVNDLDAFARDLNDRGVPLPYPIVEGRGGKQVLLEDPSGNLVELFEPKAGDGAEGS